VPQSVWEPGELGLSGYQGWRGVAVKVSANRREDELESGSSLKSAGSNNGRPFPTPSVESRAAADPQKSPRRLRTSGRLRGDNREKSGMTKVEQNMNRLCRISCLLGHNFPASERSPQKRVTVQWSGIWLSTIAKGGAQSAAEFGGVRFSGGKGISHHLEILGNLRFLIPNFRRRILQKLRIVEVAALAAANPEMVWLDQIKPGRRGFECGNGPGDIEGGGDHRIRRIPGRFSAFRREGV